MATTITNSSEIPAAPYYVTCLDTYLSEWGEAEGKANRLILPCQDFAEAEVVCNNALGRSDMKSVHIHTGKLSLSDFDLSLWQVMDRESSTAWYTPKTWSRS
jgi:hypothetical protein